MSELQSIESIISTDFLSFSYLENAPHNRVIEFCRALKYFSFCICSFSKLSYSFVAIELLTFFKNAKSIFISQESSRYLGLKNINSLPKNDCFLFSFKRFAKNIFLYINVNNNDSHQQETTCTFNIYKKQKLLRNVYIYTQKFRHFSKSKTICVTFLFTKSMTLYVTGFFMKN